MAEKQLGDRYGTMTLLERTPSHVVNGKQVYSTWSCIGDCGTERTIMEHNLQHLSSSRCSCSHKRARNGSGQSPEYHAWQGMKDRCSISADAETYSNYYGRGIEVWEDWKNSFELFLEYVGPKPEPHKNYSIDRIDNDGNYEPGNVRWATREEQNYNRRKKSNEQDKL